jgi:cell division protein FtsW
MGCAVVIVFQALMHMAIVVGLFPVSGQPLPFISKGGTSVLVMSLAIGMMLSVSRYAVRTNSKKDINQELKELPDDITSENPMKID